MSNADLVQLLSAKARMCMYIVHVWFYEFRKSTDFYAAVPIGLVIYGPLNIGAT